MNSISPTEVTKKNFEYLQNAYQIYCKNADKAVKGMNIDYTYGLQGVAEKWVDMEVVQDFFDVSVFDTGSGGWYRDRSAVPEGS